MIPGSDWRGEDADVVIRPAGPADAPALSPLCAEHAAYEKIPFDPAGHAERLARAIEGDAPDLFAWIAVDEGRAVGYATASIAYATLDAAWYLHMDCLFVRDGHRGRRIGLRLLREVTALASRLGCGRVEWQTPDWNVRAVSFYAREGAKALPKIRFWLPAGGGEGAG